MTNQQLFEYLLQQYNICNNEQDFINIGIKIKELIETSDDFDIANAICVLSMPSSGLDYHNKFVVSPEWVKAQLTRDVGNVAEVAQLLNNWLPDKYSMSWAKQCIEQTHNDNVALAAYLLYCNHKSFIPLAWVKQQIARGIDYVARTICWLYLNNQNEDEININWVKQQIKRETEGVKSIVKALYKNGDINKEWRDQQLVKVKIIEGKL